MLFHRSAEKLVLTHINSQDGKLYHNIKIIGHCDEGDEGDEKN
jgi:hypothetical protein